MLELKGVGVEELGAAFWAKGHLAADIQEEVVAIGLVRLLHANQIELADVLQVTVGVLSKLDALQVRGERARGVPVRSEWLEG